MPSDPDLPTQSGSRAPLIALVAFAIVAVGAGIWLWAGDESSPSTASTADASAAEPGVSLPSAATMAMRGALDVSDLLGRDPVIQDVMATWKRGEAVEDAQLARAFVALEAAYFLRDHAVAMRPGAFRPYVTSLLARLRAAATPDPGAGPQRMAVMKARLLSRWGTRYEPDHDYLFDFLVDGLVQCRSGTYLTLLAWLLASDDDPEGPSPVIIYTPGHVQPGLLDGETVHVIEATRRGAGVVSSPPKELSPIRIVDARLAMRAQIAAAMKEPSAVEIGRKSVRFDHGEASPMDDISAPTQGTRQDAASEPWAFGSRPRPSGPRPLAPPPEPDPDKPGLPGQAVSIVERAALASLQCGPEDGFSCVTLGRALAVRLRTLPKAADGGRKEVGEIADAYGRGCLAGVAEACGRLTSRLSELSDSLRGELARAGILATGLPTKSGARAAALLNRACADGWMPACRSLVGAADNTTEVDNALLDRACTGKYEVACLDRCKQVMAPESEHVQMAGPVAACQRGCTLGDPYACYYLGRALARGLAKGGRDDAGAAKAYAKACVGLNGAGCRALGLATLSGEGVKKQLRRGIHLLRLACAALDNAACGDLHERLAELCDKGRLFACAGQGRHLAAAASLLPEVALDDSPVWKKWGGEAARACTDWDFDSRERCSWWQLRKVRGAEARAAGERAATVLKKRCDGRDKKACEVLERGPPRSGIAKATATKAATPKEARDRYVIAAEQAAHQRRCSTGNVVACSRLAASLLANEPTEHDRARALQLLRLGCDAGDVDACAVFAVQREAVLGPWAGVLHKRACEGGVVTSCTALGRCYSRPGCGRTGEADARVGRHAARALPWLDKACTGGDPDGCVDFAAYLWLGIAGVASDRPRAEKLLADACKRRHGPACGRLAVAQRSTGRLKAAARSSRKACDLGDIATCASWAERRLAGGPGRSEGRAIASDLRRACVGGLASSCLSLGDVFADGKGVTANADMAVRWHITGCRAGEHMACARIGERWQRGGFPKSGNRLGVRAIRQGCVGGDVPSCKRLAEVYRRGAGVLKSARVATWLNAHADRIASASAGAR